MAKKKGTGKKISSTPWTEDVDEIQLVVEDNVVDKEEMVEFNHIMEDEAAVAEDATATKPVLSIKEPEVTLEPMLDAEPNHPRISPYASSPVTINVGPGHATYYVSKHLLRSPHWTDTEAGGEISLPGVSADTGHTLVHYLYTGTYQALESETDDATPQLRFEFRQALLTYMAAVTYSLGELEQLAKQQIEEHGAAMEMVAILDTIRKDFSKLKSSGWFHEYLQDKAQKAFEMDHTVFTSDAFSDSLGKGTLNRFMMPHVVKLFSEKLTYTLEEHKGICEALSETEQNYKEAGALLERYKCTTEDNLSFEFPTADCATEECVDDVISIAGSSIDEYLLPENSIEDIQAPEFNANANQGLEDQSVKSVEEEPISQAPQSEEIVFDKPKVTPEPELAYEAEEFSEPALRCESEVILAPQLESEPEPEPEPERVFYMDPFTGLRKKKRKKLQKPLQAQARLRDTAEMNPEPLYDEPASPTSDPEPPYQEVHDAFLSSEIPPPEPSPIEVVPETPPPAPPIDKTQDSSTKVASSLCPKRSIHLMKSGRWKTCKRCRTMLREVTIQLAKEESEGETLEERVEKLLLGE